MHRRINHLSGNFVHQAATADRSNVAVGIEVSWIAGIAALSPAWTDCCSPHWIVVSHLQRTERQVERRRSIAGAKVLADRVEQFSIKDTVGWSTIAYQPALK